MDKRLRILTGMLALLWLAVVVSLYYISHKPFSPSLAVSLLRAVWQSGAALAVTSVAGGLGAKLLPAPDLRPLARLALQAALGLGLLGPGILLVGTLLGIGPILAWGLLVLLGILFWRSIRLWWQAWGDLGLFWQQSTRLGRTIAVGAAVILVLTLVSALAPPVKFDALVYHLALPHAYLEAGNVSFVSQNIFWGMPQTGEMLYSWAIALGGDQAAAVLGWIFGLLALVGLAGYVADRLEPRTAWISAAALLSGFSLAVSLSWGYVEWLVILFGLSFLIAMDRWRVEGSRWNLILAGAYAGMALGTKYTAGVLLLAGLTSLAAHSWKKFSPGQFLASIFQFGLSAVFFSSPWWIKNFLATGNPFYPFLFPAGAMDALRLSLYQNPIPWGTWQEAAFLPWLATMRGVEGGPGYSASIGPLLLGLGACTWLGWSSASQRQQCVVRNAAWIALPGLLVWMIASRISLLLIQSRLYFSLFPALAVLAGAGFISLRRQSLPGIRLGRIAASLVLLVFWLNVVEVSLFVLGQGSPLALLGITSREDYLANNLGWYAPAAQAIRDLPAQSKVLMLWEPRSLYCAPKCVPDEVLDRWLHDLYSGDVSLMKAGQSRPAETILQSWREAGYTHLLFNRLGADFIRQDDHRYRPANWQVLDDLLEQLTAPQTFGNVYSLFSLTP